MEYKDVIRGINVQNNPKMIKDKNSEKWTFKACKYNVSKKSKLIINISYWCSLTWNINNHQTQPNWINQ